MSAACQYEDKFDKRKEADMSNTFEENFYIRRNAEKIAQQEEDDAKAIAGLMCLIAGLGMVIMIGIAIIGAWAQF
jgi:hypothetical protein